MPRWPPSIFGPPRFTATGTTPSGHDSPQTDAVVRAQALSQQKRRFLRERNRLDHVTATWEGGFAYIRRHHHHHHHHHHLLLLLLLLLFGLHTGRSTATIAHSLQTCAKR